MAAAKPPEFRRRAVDLARSGQYPVAKVAADLGISESCLRRWMAQNEVDAGRREGLSTDERRELVELRRRNRVLEMEVEILKRASGGGFSWSSQHRPRGSSGTGCAKPGCSARWAGSPRRWTCALMELFWSTMRPELLDRQPWATKDELGSAIFEWIEAFYNPRRRHTSLGNLSPIEHETLHTHAATVA